MPANDDIEIRITAECIASGNPAACRISVAIPAAFTTADIAGAVPEILEAIRSAASDAAGLILVGVSSASPDANAYRIVTTTGEGRVVLSTALARAEPEAILEAFWRIASALASPTSEPDAFCAHVAGMRLVSIQALPHVDARADSRTITEGVSEVATLLKRVEARVADLAGAVGATEPKLRRGAAE